MSDRKLRILGKGLCAVTLLSAPTTLVLLIVANRLSQAFHDYALVNLLAGLTFGSVGWVLLAGEARNRLTWLVIGFGFCLAIPGVVIGVGALMANSQGVDPTQLRIDEYPWLLIATMRVIYSLWVFGALGLPTFGLMLTPDGRFLSPRWRPLGWLSAGVMAMIYAAFVAEWPYPGGELGSVSWTEPVVSIGFPLIMFCTVGSLASLVVRYRRSGTMVRRQLRWVLLGSVIVAISGAGTFLNDYGAEDFGLVLLTVGFPAFAFCYGMAIWRDQLFDVDVVFSRAILFGFLAAFIGAVYVGVVFGIGSLLGRTGGDDGLSLLATVVVAFAFHPVRKRLERAANRLVYGSRATPYEVLSGLTTHLGHAESSAGLLERMVERLAAGTGAERAILWRDADEEGLFRVETVWPRGADVEPTSQLPPDAVLIESAGRPLGALSVVKRRGEELNPTERRLLHDLGGSAGLVMEKTRLDQALKDQASQLFVSRRHLVDAQAEERQRLEVQLSRGTQQQLVRLQACLADASEMAAAENADPIAQQLGVLSSEAQAAIDEIGALANGLYPPFLEHDGLAAAVQSLTMRSIVPTAVIADLTRRYELETELAFYFCIAEAITNAAKYAQASGVKVTVCEVHGDLWFSVSDDGLGFDATLINGSSTGLVGIRDRLEAVGGELTIDSTPGTGTVVSGRARAYASSGVG